ncbi:MAG: DMT family transporter [Pseudomonadota bacterium]
MQGRLATLTLFTLMAFAANSILCRLALLPDPGLADGEVAGSIDAGSFTILRIGSGALVLVAVSSMRGGGTGGAGGAGGAGSLLSFTRRDFFAGAMLFIYMASFSLAYLRLGAGLGALVLFGAVQVTMLTAAVLGGERFGVIGWTGFAIALGGLVWLVYPGTTAPDPLATASMAAAGIAWGFFSLSGRGTSAPLLSMTRAFLLNVPAAIVFLAVYAAVAELGVTLPGLLLALASGGLASGLGYVIWYSVLPELGAGRAATVQLAVPAIAAAVGVVLIGEPLTQRLILSSLAVLGGVFLVLRARRPA